jgi:hypothetical protein
MAIPVLSTVGKTMAGRSTPLSNGVLAIKQLTIRTRDQVVIIPNAKPAQNSFQIALHVEKLHLKED